MKFKVKLTRSTERHVSPDKLINQVEQIVKRAISGNRGKNWTYKIGKPLSTPVTNGVCHTVDITFDKASGHQAIAPKQWNAICSILIIVGQRAAFNKRPWLVSGENSSDLYKKLLNEEKVAPIANGTSKVIVESKTSNKEYKSFGNINTDMADHFAHIYNREHQIRIIHSALVAAKESNFINRFHCVLFGPPGCAKTDILKSTGAMLGTEGESYMIFDATSTTEAGAQKLLLDSDYIPPVLIVEEIEKTDEKSLRWLLGVLDHRAEIRKTNFKIGHRAKNVRMLCLATVNNIKLFRKVMSGALYSRFAHNIYCPRPDRELMGKILEREIAKVNGKHDWIEPTLKFCMDERGINDPRKIIPVCLCGRDDLLTGEYQKSIIQTLPPKK